MNNNGPKVEPCGTPVLIVCMSELIPSISTNCLRSDR